MYWVASGRGNARPHLSHSLRAETSAVDLLSVVKPSFAG